MRTAKYLTAALVVLGLMAAPALAADQQSEGQMMGQSGQGGGMMGQGGGMMGQDGGMMGKDRMGMKGMAEHRKFTRDIIEMTKETMAILRDLSHKPTADQQKRLDELIKKADEMIKKHDEMMKSWQEKSGAQ